MRVGFAHFYDAQISEDSQVLGDGGPVEGQHAGQRAEGGGAVGVDMPEDVDAGRMGERFGPQGLLIGVGVEGGGFREGHGGDVFGGEYVQK